MVRRDTYLNKIRALGYTLSGETKRVHIFRKKGSSPPHYIPVRKCEKLEDEFVRSTLSQAGMNAMDIQSFMAAHSC
jgi:hypothetical protein